MSKPIADFSKFNTIKDWDAVKNSVSGVIVRLGYRGYGKAGTLALDSKFKSYISEMERRRIPYGVYFVTQAVTQKEAAEECNFISKHIAGLNPVLGVWLDSEYSAEKNHQGRADNITPGMRTLCANVFANYFDSEGVKNGLYAGDYWLVDALDYNNLAFKNFWIPRYGKNLGRPDKKPTHPYDLWQYSDKCKIDGVAGFVDLSLSNDTVGLPIISGYRGTSIIEGLNQFGYDSSYQARKKYAELLGITGYRGTADQNLLMIKLLS